MAWKITYDRRVLKKDLPKIPDHEVKNILKAIQKKLTRDPEAFGKPLQGNLSQLFRLRVGSYRVIYEIQHDQVIVHVICIGARKDLKAYIEAFKRG